MLQFFSATSGEKVREPLELPAACAPLAISPEGRIVLTGKGVDGVEFTSDGTRLVWADASHAVYRCEISRLSGDPERIALWTQVITGMELVLQR